jgi:hypothetical protein
VQALGIARVEKVWKKRGSLVEDPTAEIFFYGSPLKYLALHIVDAPSMVPSLDCHPRDARLLPLLLSKLPYSGGKW